MRTSRNRVRARLTNWRWPADSEVAPRPTLMSIESTDSPTRTSWALTCSSVASLKGSTLVRTVPSMSNGSCGIMDILLRRVRSPMELTFTPSTSTSPEVTSFSRNSSTNREDFPAPVRPTIPAEVWEGIDSDTSRRAGARPGRYTRVAFLNSMAPAPGQPWGRLESSASSQAASCGTSSPLHCSSRSSAVSIVQNKLNITHRSWRKNGSTKAYATANPTWLGLYPPTFSMIRTVLLLMVQAIT
mmetsp:Transcript_38980/g.85050  ORF Transcript_38980/g.85050 Transcript_38980/m.85050 type:complete len:243 (-) Transcript_38980:1539-2267(-)